MSINRAQHTVASAREGQKEREERRAKACARGSLHFTVEPQLGLGLYDGFLWAIAQVREGKGLGELQFSIYK